MGSSVVGKFIGVIALIVLSFIIGIMTADNTKSAALVICLVAGLIGVIAMGKNVWMSLFILVPIGQAIPMFKISLYFVLVVPVLIYWCILVVLGHARFTWRKLPGADIIVLIFMCYMATVIYRHPALDYVSSGLLGLKPDTLSRHFEYVLCFFVLIYYVTFSCIPFERKKLIRVIKWGVLIKLALLLCMTIVKMDTESAGADMLSSANNGMRVRFSSFYTFALNLFIFAYASTPFYKLLFSPIKLSCILSAVAMTLISGYRNHLAQLALLGFFITIIKKEYLMIACAFIMCMATLVAINTRDTINQLPYTVQRTLAVFPWMDVNPSIRAETDGSSEYRTVLWKWALDVRNGMVNDYIWGDGCTMKAGERKRDERAYARYNYGILTHEYLARNDEWHSGFITIMKQLGIVGLVLVIIAHIYAFITAFRIAMALQGTSLLTYFLIYSYPLINSITFYFLPTNTLSFLKHLAAFSFLKVFYWIAVEEGRLIPNNKNKRYVPILIQQNVNESAIH